MVFWSRLITSKTDKFFIDHSYYLVCPVGLASTFDMLFYQTQIQIHKKKSTSSQNGPALTIVFFALSDNMSFYAVLSFLKKISKNLIIAVIKSSIKGSEPIIKTALSQFIYSVMKTNSVWT